MFKLNNYPLLFQLILLNVIGQNLTYCAAKIQAENRATPIDIELIKAASTGDQKKVKELIENGANINSVDQYGNTALMDAAGNGHKEIVELLIKKGADVNVVNNGKNTALMIVARQAPIMSNASAYNKIAELLLNAGVNVEQTILSAPIKSKTSAYKEIVELLLKAGAVIEQINKQDKNAKDLAEKYGYPEMIEMLDSEHSRREAVIRKWIKENLAKEINESTSGQLIPDVSNIIAEYTIEDYKDLPLDYRLNN